MCLVTELKSPPKTKVIIYFIKNNILNFETVSIDSVI